MADMNAVAWHYDDPKRQEIVPFIPPATRKLLDIGCGKGAFGAHLKSLCDIEVHGFEINPVAAAEANKRLDRVFHGDLEKNPDLIPSQAYDCITLLDVLEHLQDPWSLLQQTSKWLQPDGIVVASLPNVRHYPVLKDLLFQKSFRYSNIGVLDRTHLRFFTKVSVQELFIDCGFHVDSLTGINGEPFPWKWGLLNKLSGGALEDTRYLQFVVVGRPTQHAVM
jgi:2-polyprenyl-3-methyl-5-hydroxy-6-metoxy-1,4-benzoquinol methylase